MTFIQQKKFPKTLGSCDDLIGVAKTDMLVATISLVQARHGDLIHAVKQRALAKEFEVSEPSLLVVIFSLL